jgi:hypothetical protein
VLVDANNESSLSSTTVVTAPQKLEDALEADIQQQGEEEHQTRSNYTNTSTIKCLI